MKKEEKEKILDMLQDISYAHEEGEDEFWQKWSEVHKFIIIQQKYPRLQGGGMNAFLRKGGVQHGKQGIPLPAVPR